MDKHHEHEAREAERKRIEDIFRRYQKDYDAGFGRAEGNNGALQIGTFPCQPRV